MCLGTGEKQDAWGFSNHSNSKCSQAAVTASADDKNTSSNETLPPSFVEILITNFLHEALAVNIHRLNQTAPFPVLLHLCCVCSWGHLQHIF